MRWWLVCGIRGENYTKGMASGGLRIVCKRGRVRVMVYFGEERVVSGG